MREALLRFRDLNGEVTEWFPNKKFPPDPPIRGGLSMRTWGGVLVRGVDMGAWDLGGVRKVVRFFTRWV